MDDSGELLRIEALNARGEGVTVDGQIVAGALPGEDYRRGGGGPLTPSPDRAVPICRYYGVCGGCATQHLGPQLYASWKRGLVVAALEKFGVSAPVGKLIDAHGEGRRRATFHARFLPMKHDELGFMRARSHEIIEIEACPLFSPGLSGAIAAARALAGDLRGLEKPLDIQVTATLGGLDVDIRGAGALEGAEPRKLAHTAELHDLARVANHGRSVIERRPPEIAFGSARVVPPAGGFLQATAAGEEAMAALALAALKGSRKVADLFCGAGAFAFRLAPSHDVLAVDSDAPAIAAMTRARATAPDAQRVTSQARDLFHRPLRAEELDGFDGVLFDPPRAGALAQSKELAKSKVPVVVAVSCNAESFARDARALVDGGYALESVTPLDQFRFSPHVEIVAVFRRRRESKRRRGVLS
jgi:23S rRNA (uracil1939-C5)-methyltransferase